MAAGLAKTTWGKSFNLSNPETICHDIVKGWKLRFLRSLLVSAVLSHLKNGSQLWVPYQSRYGDPLGLHGATTSAGGTTVVEADLLLLRHMFWDREPEQGEIVGTSWEATGDGGELKSEHRGKLTCEVSKNLRYLRILRYQRLARRSQLAVVVFVW